MYIINDICYADGQADEIKVYTAEPLKGRMLLVTFTNGEKRLYDTTWLKGPAYSPLEDDSVFSDISIFHGIITWMNGEIDIAPEVIYEDGYPYNPIEIESVAS